MIEALAARVIAQWRSVDFDDAQLPLVAADALASVEIDADAIIAAALGHALPPQLDPWSSFGNPPVQLLVHDRFFIEALFWADGTTSVHDHSFSGAFKVLRGSSLHCTYTFESERRISQDLELGTLACVAQEQLGLGAVRKIIAGRRLIHSLFHLDRPSVTLIVRTHREESPQFGYTRPGLAERFRAETSDAILRQRMLGFLRQTDPARFVREAERAMETLALPEAVRLVEQWARVGEPIEQALAVLAKRDAPLAGVVAAASKERLRLSQLAGARAGVRDPELRYFLALLMNLHSRSALLALASEESLQRWTAALRHHLRISADDNLLDPLRS